MNRPIKGICVRCLNRHVILYSGINNFKHGDKVLGHEVVFRKNKKPYLRWVGHAENTKGVLNDTQN